MGVEHLIVAVLSFNILIYFDADSSFKVNGEEVPDPIRSSDRLLDPLADKRFDSFTNGFGEAKRGFDEINRSSFGFNKRRNFDEIGRSSFGFNKRRDFDEIGRSSFGFNKRRNFDEIGRSSFGFNKRQQLKDSAEMDAATKLDLVKRGDFDEIGRSSFGFYRRSPDAPRPLGWRFFSGFGKRSTFPDYSGTDSTDSVISADKRGFDEISRSNFGFNRRSANDPQMK